MNLIHGYGLVSPLASATLPRTHIDCREESDAHFSKVSTLSLFPC